MVKFDFCSEKKRRKEGRKKNFQRFKVVFDELDLDRGGIRFPLGDIDLKLVHKVFKFFEFV